MTSTNPSSQKPPGNATSISATKQALLERRLARMRDAVSSPTIARTSLAKDVPMSFGQERMWFLNQFEPSSAAYNRSTVLHFQGRLDITILERSLNEVLRRHQVLRTVYRNEAGRPIQEVREAIPIEIAVVDLQGGPESAREAEAERLARDEVSRSFTLSEDLMFRAQIIRFAEDNHWLILTTHHIAFDGWSQGILHDELAALYAAFRDGKASPLPELPLQYIDYATRQRDWAIGSEASQLLEWWKCTLQGAATVLELPSDYSRPSMQLMRGARSPVFLAKPLTDALCDLATRNQASLFMVLMAAWNVLLHRYTGQEDILVGFPIAGRTRRETEPLIGLFMNSLPLRTNLAGNPKFRELLSRVREMALAAYSRQDVPLQLLIESMSIQRDTSRVPLFQHMFVLQNAPLSAKHLGELSFDSIEMNTSTSKLDLTMVLRQRPEGLEGCIEYSTDLFENATIERMAGHFITLLEGIVATPDQRISQLPLLTEPERHQLLVEFNDTACEYPRELCVHELFEQQVQRTPDAVALVFEDQQLTYAELNARANRLARYLRSKGVGIETPVGMCLERSLDLVVSILGILKAGGTYVPLDAEYPKERTLHMIENSKVYAILTQRSVLDRISYLPNPLCVEQIQDASNGLMETAESIPKVPVESIAYVIHTSGSTGIPKGVAVSQSSLVNLLSWANGVLFTDVETALMGVAPATFDISLAEFLAPLLEGKTTVFTSKGIARDPVALIEQIALQNNCVVQATPATWVSLLDIGWNGRGCRTAVSTGEALPSPVRSKLLQLGLRVLDLYGPTETTIWSTYREVHGTDNYSCIGRPIANTQVYVLDSSKQLVPVGVPGELYIGGDGLARGYLNRPDLTAERFVPNPFSQDPHSRLYRTGDRCRWRADGNLEYLGRIDHQVKLRGFRIELGEIESTLANHSSIAQCVVILREDRPGDKRLVAYYTASGEIHPSIAQLREHLQASLPEYMIPSAFVHLDALPLTPSGKIDRRALPVPDMKAIDAQEHYTPPRNGMEEELVEIWQEILGIERIGIHDNFFSLGGHSLLAVQLFNTINQRFQKTLPLSLVFQRGSIAQLASSLVEASDESAIARVVRLSSGGGSGPKLIVMPGLHGQVLYALKLVERLETRFDIYGLEPNLSSNHLETFGDFRRLASEYLKIILKHQPSGPYNFVGYCYGGILGYEIARQLQQRGHRVDFIGVIDTGPNTQSSSKYLQSVAKHWMRIGGNLPRWIGANCGPENLRETFKKGSRRFRYWARRFLSQGKNEYRFEDEFGARRSHDDRHEILSRIFQGFNAYRPEPYGDRVTLFRASVRPLLHSLSPDLGWSSVTQKVRVHRIPGDHNTIIESAGLHRISDLILSSENCSPDA